MNVSEGSTTTVILGVTSSVPSLPLPNILLMANVTWPQGQFSTRNTPGCAPVITLSRILPLKFVELQICDRLQRILRIRTVTEKIYYMKLHEKHPEAVFQFWVRLVKILQKGLSITTKDPRIQFTHCLVPKRPCSSTETTPESSCLSSSQPSENFLLWKAEQTSDIFSHFPGTVRLTEDSRKQATEIKDAKSCRKTPLPSASSVNVIVPMRAALGHSLWEQENPEECLPQAPVASSLGENLLGP